MVIGLGVKTMALTPSRPIAAAVVTIAAEAREKVSSETSVGHRRRRVVASDLQACTGDSGDGWDLLQ